MHRVTAPGPDLDFLEELPLFPSCFYKEVIFSTKDSLTPLIKGEEIYSVMMVCVSGGG